MSTYCLFVEDYSTYFLTILWPLCIPPVLPYYYPFLKTFLEATWCSNSGLRSLYPATMVGQRASFGPCSAFTVAQLTIWSGQKYYTISGVTHNYYRLVLISNPFIAKWRVRRESSLTNSRPRGYLLLLCLYYESRYKRNMMNMRLYQTENQLQTSIIRWGQVTSSVRESWSSQLNGWSSGSVHLW